MEFPFRDGKQFAGLSECQSRQVEALHFHLNMALMAVSAARLGQLCDQRAGPLVFSMEDEKCRAYNEFFAESFLSTLTVDRQTRNAKTYSPTCSHSGSRPPETFLTTDNLAPIRFK